MFSLSRLLLLCSFVVSPLVAQDVHVRVSPEVKTGIQGTTEFPTIQNALDHYPAPGPKPGRNGGVARVYIEVAPGTYRERINITKNHPHITLIGLGKRPEDTVITNSLNAKQAGGTFFTATADIEGAGFEAANLTIENSAGNTGQAVAAAVRSDRAVFRHVRFVGHQDTLFADQGRQFYFECYIEGGVDFIFGNAAAVFEQTTLNSNGPGYLTAQSRTAPDQDTGYVIVNSTVSSSIPAGAKQSIFLGRPWRPYARVVFLKTALPAQIEPAGWNNWSNPANEGTAYFAEWNNSGPGAGTSQRVAWAHTLSAAESQQFGAAVFLAGADRWDARAAADRLP